ncbi:MAG: CDP-alcohol phosphatidyltransferase family protein [Bacteroidota bacterium]
MPKRVYFLIPNLIGYVRIALAVGAFHYCFEQHYLFVILYGMSQLLDTLDGYAARYFNQPTQYGAALDMVIDRVSTAALLMAVTMLYPRYVGLFMALLGLDIASHFVHMYSSLLQGKKSHKHIAQDQPWLLRHYYTNKLVLFTLCLGNEAYLLLLYLLNPRTACITAPSAASYICLWVTIVCLGTLFALKQLTSIVQLTQAIQRMTTLDQGAPCRSE